MDTISSASIKLIKAIKDKEQNAIIIATWKDLAECINNYENYEDIPDIEIVSEAMFSFVDNHTYKVYDEELVCSFIAFCLLKRAIDETMGRLRIERFIRLTLFLSRRLKYLMPVMYYTLPRHISKYSPSQIPQLSAEQIEALQKNYNAIIVFIHNSIDAEINEYAIDTKLKERYEANISSFFENHKNTPYNLMELSNGKVLLNSCYQRVLEYGKYPLLVNREGTSAFYKKSNGLIKGDFVFNANMYFTTSVGIGSTNSTFIVKMIDEELELLVTGVKEKIIQSHLRLPIRHTVIEKLDRRVQLQFDADVADNVPMNLGIAINNGEVSELRFFFLINDNWPRIISFDGESRWLNKGESNLALLSDFNFNLDNTFDYEVKEKYLPIRAMTADNMGVLGDVAIVACNPISYNNIGHFSTSYFELSENEYTEYFVFSKNSPLYNDLIRRLHETESWSPQSLSYHTIKGWVLGNLRIVHIDKRLYLT